MGSKILLSIVDIIKPAMEITDNRPVITKIVELGVILIIPPFDFLYTLLRSTI